MMIDRRQIMTNYVIKYVLVDMAGGGDNMMFNDILQGKGMGDGNFDDLMNEEDDSDDNIPSLTPNDDDDTDDDEVLGVPEKKPVDGDKQMFTKLPREGADKVNKQFNHNNNNI